MKIVIKKLIYQLCTMMELLNIVCEVLIGSHVAAVARKGFCRIIEKLMVAAGGLSSAKWIGPHRATQH